MEEQKRLTTADLDNDIAAYYAMHQDPIFTARGVKNGRWQGYKAVRRQLLTIMFVLAAISYAFLATSVQPDIDAKLFAMLAVGMLFAATAWVNVFFLKGRTRIAQICLDAIICVAALVIVGLLT